LMQKHAEETARNTSGILTGVNKLVNQHGQSSDRHPSYDTHFIGLAMWYEHPWTSQKVFRRKPAITLAWICLATPLGAMPPRVDAPDEHSGNLRGHPASSDALAA
jgi:hypothetical protein